MQFVITAYDGDGKLDKRMEVRPPALGRHGTAEETSHCSRWTAGVPLCAIIIGYPAEQPEPKDKWKPENVSYNEFGGKAE